MSHPYPHAEPPQSPPSLPTPPPAQQPTGTNTLAIIALISSFFISLAGVICGHIALGQIKKSGEQGRGLALAGVIIGYIGLALGILWIVFVFFIIGTSAGVGTISTY